jgi:hypothetical protein
MGGIGVAMAAIGSVVFKATKRHELSHLELRSDKKTSFG